MSLSEAERIFGGVTEGGLNDLLRAFFTARPRHLRYGSPGFVAATSASETQIGPIPFPGVPGGIDWLVELTIPRVDFHPQTDPLPPELSLAPGQVSVSTVATLCVACETRREKDEERPDDRERDPDRPRDDVPPGRARGTCFRMELHAVGHLERTFSPDGVRIIVDRLEIVDIEPEELEAVVECLMLQVLRAILADVALPLEALRAGAFSLTLTRGPEVEDDQLKVYGSL